MSEFSFKRTFGPKPSYPLVEKYVHPNNDFVIISGSCSVESSEHVSTMAKIVSDLGATHLRGGVFKTGTYPSTKHPFGWVNPKLIESFWMAAHENGLKNIFKVLIT